MKNKMGIQRNINVIKRVVPVFYAVPILILLTAIVSPAYAQTHYYAGWHPNIAGSWDAKGAETYMTPIDEAGVNGGRISAWIGAYKLIGSVPQWIQIGWYKGVAIPSGCPTVTVMTIYTEAHTSSGACATWGQVTAGTGHVQSLEGFRLGRRLF